ncbi:MAG: hypothetical protein ACLRRF_09620 [Clostridium fessum]
MEPVLKIFLFYKMGGRGVIGCDGCIGTAFEKCVMVSAFFRATVDGLCCLSGLRFWRLPCAGEDNNRGTKW